MRVLLIYIIVFSISVIAQPADSSVNYRTVIPGAEYSASGIHKFFFGEHWRDVWTTPVEVPVLDLDTFAGGLIPYEQGGGFQTKSQTISKSQYLNETHGNNLCINIRRLHMIPAPNLTTNNCLITV